MAFESKSSEGLGGKGPDGMISRFGISVVRMKGMREGALVVIDVLDLKATTALLKPRA